MIYCGVDGGGTKTKVAIFSDDKFIGEMVTERSSIDTIPLSEGIINIKNAITKIYKEYNVSDKIDSIFLGLGGIANAEHIANVNEAARSIKELKTNALINSGNDIMNAFRASCSGRNNITLIIGTGSVGYGIDENGNSHRAGGIHFLEGDLGSSYDVGLRLLNTLAQVFDNRAEGSKLTNHYLKKLEIDSVSDLVDIYVKHKNERTYIASFARDITKYALQGDVIANKILEDAAHEILKHIIAVDKKITLKNREIGIVGSLGNAEPYKSIIKAKIKTYDEKFKVHECELDPVIGSILEAKIQHK